MFIGINLVDHFRVNSSDPAENNAMVRMSNGKVGYYNIDMIFAIEAVRSPTTDKTLWHITFKNDELAETFDDVPAILEKAGVASPLQPSKP